MSKTVDFIFDFASPNAYLAWKVMPPMLARTGAKVNILPCLLGGIFKATGNQAPFVAFSGVPSKMAYERLEMTRFIEKHKLSAFKMNPHFPINTLRLMRGAVAADIDGDLPKYLDAGLKAMWEDGLKMDDPEVWASAFSAAGLDATRLSARIGEDDVKAKLVANTDAAVARGAFGIPSFFVGDELFFGKERLGQVEEALG